MFFKKKDKESNPLRDGVPTGYPKAKPEGVTYKPTPNKKSPAYKNANVSKDTKPSEEAKKPMIDTSFVFFEDK